LLENISPGPADEASQTVSFEVQPLQPPFAELFSTPPSVGPDGTLTFTPAVDAATGITGPVPVRILARDSGDASSGLFGFQIVITEVNDTPFAANDLLSGDEDTVQSIDPQTLISNDLDPDLNTNPSENLTVELVGSTSESGATVSIDPISGAIIYDPTVAAGLQSLAPGETSFDTFAYQLVDAAGAVSNSAVVSIDISGVNDPPRLLPDTPQLQIGGPTVIDALANDTDIDGNLVPSSIEFPQLPSFGSISVSSGGLITYTPFDPGFEGEDSFTYTVADNLGARSESAVVALSTNAGPLAVGDLATTLRGQAVEIDVAGNDVDIDGQIDLGSIEIVTSPLRGTATPQSDGTVVYTPAAGFVGNDSFAYRISDTQGRHSNVATVGISVIASSLQNTVSRWDVNDDGAVTALDALLVLNHLFLRSGGTGVIQVEPDDDPFQGTDENGDPIWRYYDVNGDQRISASDALEIVNRLRELNIESEAEGEPTATVSATMPAPAAATLDSGDPSSDEDPAPLTGKAVRKVSSHSLPPSVSGDVIDLIAADHDQKNDDEREEMTAAIDQTLARLL